MNITLQLKIEKMKNKLAKKDLPSQNLIEAARAGNLAQVQKLLHENVWYKKETLNNALYSAAEAGELKVVQLLVEKGADVNQEFPECYFNTPLKQAICTKQLSVVEYLLQQGADVNHQNSHTKDYALDDVLFNARYYPLAYIKNVLNLLIEYGADLSINGTSPQEKFEEAAAGVRENSHCLKDADERISFLKNALLTPRETNKKEHESIRSPQVSSHTKEETPMITSSQPIVHLILKNSLIYSKILTKTQSECNSNSEKEKTEVLSTSLRRII